MTSFFYSTFFVVVKYPLKWCTYSAFDCYMAGATWNCCHLRAFCVHHTIMHHVTSLHANPHMYGVHVFSCNLSPALLAEWLGSFTCYCVTRGWNVYWNKSQHRKLTLEKKILPLLLPELVPETFRSRVRHANHWVTPLPVLCVCEHRPLAPNIILSLRVCVTRTSCDTCGYWVLPVLLSKLSLKKKKKNADKKSRDHFKTKSLLLTFWFWFLHPVGKKLGLRELTSQTNER